MIDWWGRINNWLFIAVLAGFVGFGIYAIASLIVRFGLSSAVGEIGFLTVGTLAIGVLIEAVRAIRHKGVPPRWWVTLGICLLIPVFFLGAVAAATPPVGEWTFYVVVVVISSIVFQKFMDSRVDTDSKTP